MPDGAGMFVGVGVDTYDDPALQDLVTPIREVHRIAGLLGAFESHILNDPRDHQVDDLLASLNGAMRATGGPALLVWSGHGLATDNPPDVRLLLSDSEATVLSGLGAREIIRKCVAFGCSQLLCIVDTCSSGAILDAAVMANDLIEQAGVAADELWVGIIVACRKVEYTQEARLGPFVADMLTRGPDVAGPHGADLRRRWSPRSKLIRGDDLCDAVVKQWNLGPPTPNATTVGNAIPMLPNPFWVAAAPAVKASVLTSGIEGTTFFGRTGELSTVLGWLTDQTDPGIWAVTGSAGTGKSALVSKAGAIVREENPATDRHIAYVTVAGQSIDGICQQLDTHLSAIGCIQPQDFARNRHELLGSIERARAEGAELPVFVLDGLTEAETQIHDLLTRLINPLSELGRVLAISRPVGVAMPALAAPQSPQEAPRVPGMQPIGALLTSPDRILDLDSPRHRESGWDAVSERIARRLTELGRPVEIDSIITAIRSLSGSQSPAPFVLAEILCDHLQTSFSDATVEPGVAVARAVQEMVSARVAQADHPNDDRAWDLLEALSWGQGLGLPESLWLEIANARSRDSQLIRSDIDWLIDVFGDYIIEDSEFEEAVYRCAHDLINRYLRSRSEVLLADEGAHYRVARSVLANAANSEHARVYGWRYVAAAGVRALALLEGNENFTVADRANATLGLSIDASTRGRADGAVSLAQQAVVLAEQSSSGELRAYALTHLANCLKSVGELHEAVPQADQAVRELATLAQQDSTLVTAYVAALHNLASFLQDLGRLPEALGVANEVVAVNDRINEEASGENAYSLGIALNLRALIHAGLLDAGAAVVDSRAAVINLRSAVENRRRIGDKTALAQALTNLGRHLADVDELEEGTAVSREGVTVLAELLPSADENIQREYAGALSDYANRLHSAGKIDQAINCQNQAIELLGRIRNRALSTSQMLFGLLNNRCAVLVDVDASEAEEAGRHAIAIAEQYALHPVYQADLALGLDNYANALTRLNRHGDALRVTSRALEIYRASSHSNLRAAEALARTLMNFSVRLGAANLPGDAVVALEEVCSTYQALAESDPRFSGDVALATAELAHHLMAAGRVPQARAAAREATALADILAPEGMLSSGAVATIFVQATKAVGIDDPDAFAYADRAVDVCRAASVNDKRLYGTALRNLAAVNGARGDFGLGLELIEVSIEVFESLASDEGQSAPDLVSAMATKVHLQFSLGAGADAIVTGSAALSFAEQITEFTPQSAEHVAEILATLVESGRTIDPDLPIDVLVDHWIERTDEHLRPYFCIQLISRIPPTEAMGPPLIIRTLKSFSENDRETIFRVHALARGKRAAAGLAVYDQHWLRTTETPSPDWLTVDRDLVGLLGEWASQPTYTSGLILAARYPTIFDETADVAAEEVFLTIDPGRAARLRKLRQTARAASLRDAYRIPLVIDIADVFVDAPFDRQIEMVTTVGEVLHEPEIQEHIRERCIARSNLEAFCIVALSSVDQLHRVLGAADNADEVRQLLESLASEESAKTVARAAVVIVAFQNERRSSPGAMAVATVHLAANQIENDNRDNVRDLIAAAREVDPTSVGKLIASVARLSASHPAYEELLSILTEVPAADEND